MSTDLDKWATDLARQGGYYRVFYQLATGERGFYAIQAEDEQDALQEGRRLAKIAYEGSATVTGARFMRCV